MRSIFPRAKKEAIYHNLYKTPDKLIAVMEEYIHFHNEDRPHRKLNMKTPLQFEAECRIIDKIRRSRFLSPFKESSKIGTCSMCCATFLDAKTFFDKTA